MTDRPRRFGLSKSKITMFEQCPKRLWLSVHRRELAAQDEGAEARFATGHEVGALACALLPNGVMIEAEPDLAAALAKTQALLDNGHHQPIFEATLQHDGVLVRIDVLEPDGAGGWHMAEVKSSTKAKDYHVGDLATQLWVARNAGVPISSAAIRHIDSSFVLERDGDLDGLFADTDLMAQAEPIIAGRGETVAAARATLVGAEPDTAPGAHCDAPFPCEFAGYCHAALPAGPEWPVSVLPHGGGKRWIEQGVVDLLAVDPAALSNAVHARVHRATVSGEVYHDVEGARAAMAGWAFPRTWLDFETIGFAVPRWIGTRPYQQVPFQFSAHVETADGVIMHREFLSLDGSDPRRACAEALVEMVPPTGAVIGYNASFEKGRILELAAAFPDLADALSAMAVRVVDLLPVTRANWYHRNQRGSWSIKTVLPTIAAEMDYAALEVKDGGSAQEAYAEAVSADCTAERRLALDAALRAYCGRDTEAMIVLARRLQLHDDVCGRGEMTMDDDANSLMLESMPPKRALRDRIDRLSVSADAKALLNDLLEMAIEVGGRVIDAGRRILAFVFDLVERFPNTAFGVIVALVVSTLIASIPLLGVVLGPLLSPLLLAFGLAAGAIADLKDAPLRARVGALERHFASATHHA